QSNEAHADVSSITCVPAAGSTVPVGGAVNCRATTAAGGITAVTWSTTGTAGVNVTNGTVLTTIGAAPSTDATFTTTSTGTFQVTVVFTDGGGQHPASQANQTTSAFTVVGTTGGVTPVAAGQNATVTFNIPAGLTYCSDAG